MKNDIFDIFNMNYTELRAFREILYKQVNMLESNKYKIESDKNKKKTEKNKIKIINNAISRVWIIISIINFTLKRIDMLYPWKRRGDMDEITVEKIVDDCFLDDQEVE